MGVFLDALAGGSANEATEKRSKSRRATRRQPGQAEGWGCSQSASEIRVFFQRFSLALAALLAGRRERLTPGWSAAPAGGHGGASGLRSAFVGPEGSVGKGEKKKTTSFLAEGVEVC